MKLTSPSQMRKSPEYILKDENISELNNLLIDLENDLSNSYLDQKSIEIVLLGRFSKYRNQINEFYQNIGWKKVKVWTTFDDMYYDYITVFTFIAE